MSDCLFCKIIAGEIPSKKVFEDEYAFAFHDIDPKAPTHILIVPKKHIRGLKEASAEDAEIVGRCHLVAAQIARQLGIEDGYRTVLNVGPKAGQSVFHLHVHLLGGRDLHWPPG
jgi:histidine triad (HIT) family protein